MCLSSEAIGRYFLPIAVTAFILSQFFKKCINFCAWHFCLWHCCENPRDGFCQKKTGMLSFHLVFN